MEKRQINRDLSRCTECGRRIPTRNNQASMECRKAGLCRTCWETTYSECKDCANPLPKGRGVKSLAARTMGYCLDCYKEHFPEPETRDMDDATFEPLLNEPSSCGWEWLESVRILYDEADGYER